MSDYPLHQACMNNNLSQVQEILQNSEDSAKDIIERDQDNRTPLHWATSFQCNEIVTYLLSHMKTIDLDTLTDEAGWTPFHIAASVGNLFILKELFERDIKPDINLQTVQGVTALHLAVSKSHFTVVDYLLNNGANVRIRDKKGQIPLHRAVAIGSIKLVTLLCDKSSPINWKDNQSWSPLFHALAEGHGDVAILLVNNYDADKDQEDNNGNKAADVSLNDEVKKFFENHI